MATSTASASDVLNGIKPEFLLNSLDSYLEEHHSQEYTPLARILLTHIIKHTSKQAQAPTPIRSTSSAARTPSRGREQMVTAPTSKGKPKGQPAKPANPRQPDMNRRAPSVVRDKVKVNLIPFEHQKHVKCSTPNCTFCVDLWNHLPLSQCSSVVSHANKSCNDLGWYKHVTPSVWGKLVAAHKRGEAFDPESLPLSRREVSSVESRGRKRDRTMTPSESYEQIVQACREAEAQFQKSSNMNRHTRPRTCSPTRILSTPSTSVESSPMREMSITPRDTLTPGK